MLDRLSNYINDQEFKITLYEGKINILNYQKIISLEDNYLSILTNNKKITITGTKIILVKLLDREMLIKGNISKLEVVDV